MINRKFVTYLFTFVIMRALIQRVSSAEVKVDGLHISEIGSGLLVLLGIEEADEAEDVEWLSSKIVQLRIFDDPQGVMNLSLNDTGGGVIVVSQFTLHAKTRKGNRPSYIRAAPPEKAIPLYEEFITRMETLTGRKVGTGRFGARMDVSLVNNGPVTIFIDTRNRE